jgi:D-alanine transfer protein
MFFGVSKSRFHLHVIAVVIACSIAVCGAACGYLLVRGRHVMPPYDGKYIPDLGQGTQATTNLIELNSALSDGETLVVLGSSELTHTMMRFIPYNFLPDSLHLPVLAYGRAGFESFGVYGLLAANADALSPRTKLVILVSPRWFAFRTLPLDPFIKYFQPQVLTQLYQNPEARELVRQYLKLHFDEFDRWTLIDEAFVKSARRYMFYMRYVAFADRLFSARAKAVQLLIEPKWLMDSRAIGAPLNPHAIPWDQYDEQGRDMELGQMHNNRQWVRDDYYEEYRKDLPPDGALYFNGALDDAANGTNAELSMLRRALEFLQSKEVHALIVMEPLNPFVYKDADRIKPIAQQVEQLCLTTGMRYFDMTTNKYEPGTLRDGMHLGELGWSRVDRQIAEYLESK